MHSEGSPAIRARVVGQGVAAYCCAHLLDAAGIGVAMDAAARPRVPAILLNEATQQLIGEIFGVRFEGLPVIEKRVVAWGGDAVTVPHRAVVISEEALTAMLRPAHAAAAGKADWTVVAARPLPAPCVEHAFGTRLATARAVRLKSEEPACWIESLPAGWLFLIPTGWLLSVGGTAEELLAQSRLVVGQIREIHGGGTAFPAHPRISKPLCGPGWLGCGTAALAFDPICGDGTGYAIREGILAAAVIRAAVRGEAFEGLLAHYTNRVTAGFRRHLELCREFYRSGGNGDWWRAELAALERGVEWCRTELGAETFRYRLNGFELERAG